MASISKGVMIKGIICIKVLRRELLCREGLWRPYEGRWSVFCFPGWPVAGATLLWKPSHSKSQGQQVVSASFAVTLWFHCTAVQESNTGTLSSIMIVIKLLPLLLMHLITVLPGGTNYVCWWYPAPIRSWLILYFWRRIQWLILQIARF